jgi:hypothetical protein
MTFKRVAVLAVVASCTSSAALAQEQSASAAIPNEAGWQKQCADKAAHDKLGDDLRPTFMMECVASAKLDAPQKPAEQK